MNYNDQCRPSRHRVLNNYSRSSGCSCSRATEEKKGSDGGCGYMPAETSHPCPISPKTAYETRSITGSPCTTTPVSEGCVDTYPIAMAYVPMQKWQELYDPASGLSRGTIFRELDLEWYPTNCRKDCRK